VHLTNSAPYCNVASALYIISRRSASAGYGFPFTMTLGIIIAFIASVLLIVYRFALRRANLRASLPPGPQGHWLFGNVLPGAYAYRHYAELIETYGPVISLRYGSRIVCIVGRYQAAVDILSKHSNETVDRPRTIAANEILSLGLRTVLMGAGKRLTRARRVLHAFLQKTVAHNYKPLQFQNSKNYVLDIYHRPENHLEHAKRYAASVVMSITYGKTTPTSYSDPEVQAVNKYIRRIAVTLRPGAYLVDTYPILKYIPGYLSHLRRYQKEEYNLYSEQLGVVRKRLMDDGTQPSFAAYLLQNQVRLGLSDQELAYLTGSMFGAGSDTTAAALGVVTMAAACHPEAQARVQAQIDKVVGRQRVPTFEDEEALPEVTAFFLEAYRWRPVTAGGFAHRATKDIIWKNYIIPAGAEVIGNHWAISRDPEIYPNPEVFEPQRWLDENGRLRGDMKFFNFGFGRRVCVGQHVADNSLFINTALILWAFNISEDPAKPIDRSAFTDSALVHPKPFAAIFQPRTEELEELLH